MKTKKIYTRRKSRTGILAAGILAGGLLLGGTGAGFELAAPSPVTAVHAAAPAQVPWPQPGQPGGGPGAAVPAVAGGTSAKAKAASSHTILKSVARIAVGHVIRHGFHRPRLLPWWLRRRGGY